MFGTTLMSMVLILMIEITSQFCSENEVYYDPEENPNPYIRHCVEYDYDDADRCIDYMENYKEPKLRNKTMICYSETVRDLNAKLESQGDYPFELIVKHSNLQILSPISSQKTWTITKLQLVGLNISKIIPGYFNHMSNLTVLKLQENSLTELTDGVFSSLKALQSLNLSGNNLERLGQHSFSGTVNLKHLDLSNNKIATLPDGLVEYDLDLRELNVSHNEIKHIGKLFSNNSNVNIKSILLTHNQLEEIDLNNFPFDLNSLDLSWNKITRLQNFNLPFRSITNLSISNNKLRVLSKFGNVLSLNASSNNIQELSDNVLSEQLFVLDLSNNSLSQISATAFSNLTKLQFLYLHHNNLSDLPTAGFRDLTDLQYLDLSQNHLFQLQYGLLGNCKNLHYLDISDNNLNFELQSLATLSKLKEFRFANNYFKNFNVHTLLQHFSNLKTVSLLNNFWKCKELADVVHSFEHNKISVIKGDNYDQNNVLGIQCFSDNEKKENQETVLGKSQSQSQDTSDNAFIKYLDNNLKNTNFYKYMESLKLSQNNTAYKNSMIKYFESDFKNSSFYKYLESLKQQNENITDVLKTFYMKFLNEDFMNTSFFKHIETLKPQNNNTQTEDFYRSSMVKYFDTGFKNSNFYKYLEDFKDFRQTNGNTTGGVIQTLLAKFLNENSTKDNYKKALKDSVSTYLETDFKNTSFYKLLEKTASLATVRENIYDTTNTVQTAKLEGIMERNNYSSTGSNIFNVASCILLLCLVCLSMYQVLAQRMRLFNAKNEQLELSTTHRTLPGGFC